MDQKARRPFLPVCVSLALIGALTCTGVRASGVFAADVFVLRDATDVPLERYDAGDLGVVLPGYAPVYLYPAWRAIVLGREGLKKFPASPAGLGRALGPFASGWYGLAGNMGQPAAFQQWAEASSTFRDGKRPPDVTGVRDLDARQDSSYGGYVNCPSAAFEFAKTTLQSLQGRPDATPLRLKAWVEAQDAVFNLCDRDAEVKQGSGEPSGIPQPLSAAEPLFWRQLRGYQIAAAYFYAGDHAKSAERFTDIGATKGHPMQTWGAYLALRSHIRMATLDEKMDRREQPDGPGVRHFKQLKAEADRILADPGLSSVHEATRATVRALQYRFTPLSRFNEISAVLDDPTRDPYVDDHLGDWRRLFSELNEGVVMDLDSDGTTPISRLPGRYAYFDWIDTLYGCKPTVASDKDAPLSCKDASDHAIERWKQAETSPSAHAAGLRRAWLAAAVMQSDTPLPPQIEQAALAVPPDAPEYLTVRYHLARLYRLAGQRERAREVSEQALQAMRMLKFPSMSAENLFKQERLAAAISVADAAPYLSRRSVQIQDPDTQEADSASTRDERALLASDGQSWLNSRLSVADLMILARTDSLDAGIRRHVAVAAWMRADFLDRREQALEAASLAEQLAPAVAPVAKRYRALKSPEERRHWLILNAVTLNLSPVMQSEQIEWADASKAPDTSAKEDLVAGMWCSITKPSGFDEETAKLEAAPPLPELSADPKERDREVLALSKFKTATGFVGDHVLAWASSHPKDPDVPWLLHVVVLSTRGGCLDPGAGKLSKAAYKLLHARYPKSVWARKTPYWY